MGFRNYLIAALALILGACASVPPPPSGEIPANHTTPPRVVCQDCGRVERIEVVQATGDEHAAGAVLGGIVGGIAGSTNDRSGKKQTYRVSVRMDDGRHLTFAQGMISPNLRQGSHVRIDNGRVILLR